MVTVFPSTSYNYTSFQVSSARTQYLLNLATAVVLEYTYGRTKFSRTAFSMGDTELAAY
jgi:hypothetical protein